MTPPAAWLHWTLAAGLLAGCGGGNPGGAPLAAAQPCGSGACVSTVAGTGEFGVADGPAADAQFFMPHALAMDASAQLHVADFGSSSQTRLIAAGDVSTLDSDPVEFPEPGDEATGPDGARYVADTYGNRILRIAPDGTRTIVAGTGQAGDQDGAAASATFSLPAALVFDAQGALYVADMGNRKIRRIVLP